MAKSPHTNSPTDSPALLTVGDAALRLNVTPRTLKYYEERGLVTPTRSEGRYRLYDEQNLEQFARILRLRSLGFSLHGIAEMLKRPLESAVDGRRRYSQDSLQHIADALAQQIDTLDARIAAVRRELKEAQIRADHQLRQRSRDQRQAHGQHCCNHKCRDRCRHARRAQWESEVDERFGLQGGPARLPQ